MVGVASDWFPVESAVVGVASDWFPEESAVVGVAFDWFPEEPAIVGTPASVASCSEERNDVRFVDLGLIKSLSAITKNLILRTPP